MTERPHGGHGPGAPAAGGPGGGGASGRAGGGFAAPTDSELDVRAIVGFGIGLGALIAVSLAAVWLISAYLKSAEVGRDPEPSPLAETSARRQPPGPRLQTAPVAAMKTLRAQEDEVLNGYGWVDRAAGTGRIPIDRAIDILATQGLPEPRLRPAASASAPPQATRSPGAASGTQQRDATDTAVDEGSRARGARAGRGEAGR